MFGPYPIQLQAYRVKLFSNLQGQLCPDFNRLSLIPDTSTQTKTFPPTKFAAKFHTVLPRPKAKISSGNRSDSGKHILHGSGPKAVTLSSCLG